MTLSNNGLRTHVLVFPVAVAVAVAAAVNVASDYFLVKLLAIPARTCVGGVVIVVVVLLLLL